MSTRAYIGRERRDGMIESVRVGWSGSVPYTGHILYYWYQEPERITQLLALGDLLLIGRFIGEPHSLDAHFHGDPDVRHMCCAYERDGRFDAPDKPATRSLAPHLYTCRETFQTVGTKEGIDHLYLYRGGEWWHARPGTKKEPIHWERLRDVLADDLRENARLMKVQIVPGDCQRGASKGVRRSAVEIALARWYNVPPEAVRVSTGEDGYSLKVGGELLLFSLSPELRKLHTREIVYGGVYWNDAKGERHGEPEWAKKMEAEIGSRQ